MSPSGGRFVSILVMAATLACHHEGLRDPPRQPPWLRFEPPDARSDVGDELPRVVLRDIGNPIDPALVSRLAGGVELVLWPEMTGVRVDPEVICCDPPGYGSGGGATAAEARVIARPQRPLDPARWHALVVGREIVAATLQDERNAHRLPDGRALARFAVAGPPSLTAIRVCEKSGGRTVYVDFSEPMRVGPEASGQLSVAQDGNVPCAESPDGDLGVRFYCDGAPRWRTMKVVVRDVLARSGEVARVPIEGGSRTETSATLELAVTDPHHDADGCWRRELDL